MRIAHFIQRYPPALGGSEAYFARLSRYFAACGDEVTVFTTTGLALEAFWDRKAPSGEAGIEHEDGVIVRRYSVWHCPGRRYLLKAASLVPQPLWQCLTLPCNPICPAMWRDCNREALTFDVVHAAAFPYAWPIVCGLRLARRLGVPFLLTPFLHLGDPDDPRDRTRRGYLSPALRWLLRQADAIFVQTPSEHAAVLELGVSPACVQLQGLGVDPSECTGGNRARAQQRWRVGPETMVVGHLANNSREKGTVDLLLAVEQLWRRGLDIRVVLAGPEMPNFRAFWQEFVARSPLATRVIRLGPLSDDDKRQFFAGIDVFALPSRSDSFGLVLLEAWANAVPNVAYRAGGIADVIRDGDDGLLVPCGEVTHLADALAQLHVNPTRRRDLGARGQRRLAVEFSWEEKLELVSTAYRALVQQVAYTAGR
jgi:glycosyltransferase involved in cell wall biosynthesis